MLASSRATSAATQSNRLGSRGSPADQAADRVGDHQRPLMLRMSRWVMMLEAMTESKRAS